MKGKSIDYFENSRRATYVQQQYAIDNPAKFEGYNANCWGITASDGPGPESARSRIASGNSLVMMRAACPMAPTTEALPPGRWSLHSLLHLKSCCPRLSISRS